MSYYSYNTWTLIVYQTVLFLVAFVKSLKKKVVGKLILKQK